MGSCLSIPQNAVASKRSADRKRIPQTDRKKSVSSSNHASEFEQNFHRSVKSRPDTNVLNQDQANGSDIYGRYVFGKELGRGEFGITYSCFDYRANKNFACKIIPKEKLRTETDVEDVRREVEIMRHLPKHLNIVRLREVYEDRTAVYLVMELCEGGELFDRIVAQGHYTERAAVNVIKTIVEFVQVCHQHGVIHRDLKPENFLFSDGSEDSPLKAIDFGLSIFFEPGQRFSEIVGSPYYMAPEVLRRNYGPEIDIWSAGIILYILLCGVPPFWAETEEGIAHAIVRSEIDFGRDPWPKVSEDAKDLVRRMLDPNPYSRLTVEEVLEHSWIQKTNKALDVPLGEKIGTKIRHFSLVNKFKKRVLSFVADSYELPIEKVDRIKDIFDVVDKDKNGNLTFQELRDGLPKIGQTVPDPEIKMLMEAADIDGNGTLNRKEFSIMMVYLQKISSDKFLTKAFFHFDKNMSGYIEFEELREALNESKQVIQDIIFDVDLDKDGRISYDEFRQMMKSGMDWMLSSRQYSRSMLTAVSLKLFKDKPLQFKNGSLKIYPAVNSK